MKVTHTPGDHNTTYHYRVDIPRSNMHTVEEVTEWVIYHAIPCCIIPGLAYFRNSEDAILFVLRWS